jgi:hypothetical protein
VQGAERAEEMAEGAEWMEQRRWPKRTEEPGGVGEGADGVDSVDSVDGVERARAEGRERTERNGREPGAGEANGGWAGVDEPSGGGAGVDGAEWRIDQSGRAEWPTGRVAHEPSGQSGMGEAPKQTKRMAERTGVDGAEWLSEPEWTERNGRANRSGRNGMAEEPGAEEAAARAAVRGMIDLAGRRFLVRPGQSPSPKRLRAERACPKAPDPLLCLNQDYRKVSGKGLRSRPP